MCGFRGGVVSEAELQYVHCTSTRYLPPVSAAFRALPNKQVARFARATIID
jgi:hypothetical protein